MNSMPYAEDINYWKTGQSSPDTWMDKAKKQITNLGGVIFAEGYGSEPQTGRAAYMLGFKIGDDQFKIIWPVLLSRTKNEKASRIQAATMLYHDVKAKCISAAVLGVRTAFFSFLMLPDGRMVVEVSAPELLESVPRLLVPGNV